MKRWHLMTFVMAAAALAACGKKDEMPAPAPTPVADAASAASSTDASPPGAAFSAARQRDALAHESRSVTVRLNTGAPGFESIRSATK